MSKPLHNPKHERFAVLLASGAGILDAYERAGFKRHRQNAQRLRKAEHIQSRVDDLLMQQSAAVIEKLQDSALEAAYGRREAMQESAAALNLAHRVEQPGAAVAAIALRSKLNGLLVERKEIGGPGAFAELSDDELRARLAAAVERLGLPKPPVREIIEAETIEPEVTKTTDGSGG